MKNLLAGNGNSTRHTSILWRTIVLCWLVTMVTIILFAFSIIPSQRASLMDSLRSKGQLVSTSIADVASGAIVIEDYSSVVDHCMKIVKMEKPSPISSSSAVMVFPSFMMRAAGLPTSWRANGFPQVHGSLAAKYCRQKCPRAKFINIPLP